MNEMILMVTVCFAILFCWVMTMREKERAYQEERELWRGERQQLLDRIQAPTYDHLKHHEAKIMKAQQPPREEQPKVELV